MAWGQGARRPILGLLSRAQRQAARGYTSATFETHLSSNHFAQNGMICRRFSSEVPASEQMNLIKRLRERTCAPIKDVKASLVSCNWDIEDAQKDLRKRGVISAAKKSSRTAAEGLLAIAQDEKRAVVVELNCETDFVARNDVFQYLASSLAKMALSAQDPGKLVFPFTPAYLENMSINLDHPKLSGETTVQNAVTEVAAMVGENVKLRRGFMLSTTAHGVVSSYLHTCPQPGLGRIAGLITLEAEDSSASLDALKRVGSSIAMHIVAAKPLFLSKDLVSAAALENERDVLRTQAESSGKPQMAIEKMVEGQLRKYFEDVVLLEQKYVVNDSTNIKTLLNDLSKEVGSKVTIGNFIRMEVGEGIERPEETAKPEAMACAAIGSAGYRTRMSSTSCLAPPPPRLTCGRVRLPPPSAAAERPSLRFKPRVAAPTKGWGPVHISCFKQEHDVSTTSDDGTGFKYNEQAEISGDPDLKEEDGGIPNRDDENYVKGDWFVRAQKIKGNLQETVSRFWNERWAVPWTGQTITQVMFLWIATFWLVGSWIVPFLAHAAGFSKETLTHRGQALYSLVTDITEGLAGIAILHQCLGRFRPLPPGWFEFKLKGRWHWDVALGCLLFPLVNLLSHINISLVHMSSGPVAGVSSVEQSIMARDPVAMVLYAVVVTVCAPIWEEIVFRGFLLPSLTRYMPLPWSILLSAAAFALAHFNVQRVLPLIFLGVVMGGVFARSRNLLASMVLHSLWNGFVFLDLMK
ncbi:uncharacterized protein LOC125518994 [Triticum urartu]|nr:uncharacterized protein LOC125518994 [Triticum urartu]